MLVSSESKHKWYLFFRDFIKLKNIQNKSLSVLHTGPFYVPVSGEQREDIQRKKQSLRCTPFEKCVHDIHRLFIARGLAHGAYELQPELCLHRPVIAQDSPARAYSGLSVIPYAPQLLIRISQI